IVSVNDKNYTVGLVNGKANLTLSGLANGTYTIKAIYAGDDKYVNATSNTETLEVNKVATTLTVNVESPIFVGEDAVITITMDPSINTTVTLRIGDKTYDVAIVNGKGYYNVSGLANATYNVNVTFTGNDKYVESFNNTTLAVNKLAYEIIIDVNDIRVGQNQTIRVILPADVDVNNNLVIKVNNTPYEYTIVNGIAYINYEAELAGNYVVNVTYGGDAKYVAGNNTKGFVVNPSTAYEIGLAVDNHTYGQDTTITVTVPANVTENVTITVDGNEYSLKADNGVATLVLNNLTGGLHTVVATYPGDELYLSKSKSTTFTIAKADSSVVVNFTTPQNVGDDVVVNVTMGQEINGTVILTVGSNNYTVFVVNGNGSYILSGLANATYNIKAVFEGNENYTEGSSDVKTLEINKIPTEVTLTVNDTIKVGQDAIVNVEINKNINATVVVSVNNKNYTVSIVNGKGKLVLSDLANGTYNINATFAGDDKYIGDVSNTETLEVNKYETNLTVRVSINIIVGDDAVITINLNESINTTVKLTVGDDTYDVAVINGAGTFTASNLANGTYDVNATFAGNDKYSASASSVKNLEVNKFSTVLYIDVDSPVVVGSDVIVGVDIDQAINITVTVSVNNRNYTVGLLNGKGNLTLSNLANGTYSIKAVYAGDNKYMNATSNTETLTVNKVVTVLAIDVDSPVDVGSDVIVGVELNQAINATVIVRVNDNNYTVGLVNGKGNLTLSGLTNGTYSIRAIYAGDDKYVNATSNTETLEVNKVATTLTVDVESPIFVGGDAIITITMNPSINATVALRVGENVYNVAVVNGVGTYTASNLANGTYAINATYSGDNKYVNSTSNIKSLEVNKIPTNLSIKVDRIGFVGSDLEIEISLNQSINTTVIVKVNDDNYNVGLINGNATLILSNLTEGNYEISASYSGDNKYVNATSDIKSLVMYKSVTQVVIDVDHIVVVGTDVVVGIDLNPDINTTVVVSVNGTKYYVAVVNGIGNLTLSGLANGTYLINATYAGNDQYLNSTSNTETLEVNKVVTSLSIDVDSSIDAGENVVVTINMNPSINTIVTLKVADRTYNVAIVNGNGKYNVSGLVNGTYKAEVTFAGDDKYVASYNNTTFAVKAKVNSSSIANITIDLPSNGTSGVINVTLPENATGNVTVIIDGKEYNVTNVTNGTAVIYITDILPGNHTVEVIYSGDGNYTGITNTTDWNISKLENYTIVASSENITEGQTETIGIDLNIDVDGIVLVTIGDKGYYANVTGGRGSLVIGDLTNGTYTAVVKYMGDDWYAAKSNSTTFTVKAKVDSSNVVNITVDIPDNSTSGVVNVTLPENATGNVTVIIDGKEYNVTNVTNGTAVIYITEILPGNHTIEVIY
ncbi:MAG: Ig-like domain repeat protein, partial [Methanobrevibacter sp.]|nr:Ig-like domain repeat protein [Methanobrevibacter sp.]